MRKDLRTEPNVESGIKVNDTDGSVRLIAYEPGNGTRYSVVLACLESLKKAEYVLGGSILIHVTNFGRGFILPEGKIHHHFVQEKLRCSIFDAVVLAELLGYLLETDCTTMEQFVQEMSA